MKRKIYIILIVVCMANIVAGCGGKVVKPTGMTAEETVQKYFYYWNSKNDKGMRSLEYKKLQGADRQLNCLNSVELKSCIQRENFDKNEWNESWYKNPFDCTCVDANFTIDAKNGSAFSSGTYTYEFFLVKESENADWIIVMYGQG